MAVLLIAEHDGHVLKKATQHAACAALKIDTDVHILVAGTGCDSVAQAAASLEGIGRVLIASAPCYEHALAEPMAVLIAGLASGYSHILAPSTTSSKDFLPRAAGLLKVSMLSDVSAVLSPDTFERFIYAGNAVATVKSHESIKVLTIRTTSFDAIADQGGTSSVEPVSQPVENALSSFVKDEFSKSERPDLTAARVVVSGGRGMGSGENFKLIDAVADRLSAAVGASRAAVDAGFVPNDFQVGQTGKVVAPELYIAVGISGAIQHLAGMKDSKVIVAINKDGEAPIFQVADYGLVADLFQALPELERELSK